MSMRGGKWKLDRNGGTNASQTWTTMKRVVDVNCPLQKDTADVSRRESDWEMFIGGLKKSSLDFEYVYKNGADADFAALIDSFVNDTPIGLACTDLGVSETGAFGFSAYWVVEEAGLDQKLKEGMKIPFKLKLTDYEELVGEGEAAVSTLIEPEVIGLEEEEAEPEA